MQESYLFEGLILPERAQFSLKFGLRFKHLQSGRPATAEVSIELNKVLVWLETEDEWNIFDLRNVVKTLLKNELVMFGFLKGFAYELELFRVTNRKLKIDYIFGVETACIVKESQATDIDAKIHSIRPKLTGPNGIFLYRCLHDFVSAMKDADDTGFFCYRSIESLRQHCRIQYALPLKNKDAQWSKLREIANCSEDITRKIKEAADPARHGEIISLSSEDRELLLTNTWKIINTYLDNC